MISNNREICKELDSLIESLTPHEACHSLLLNQLDFYYVTYCSKDIPLRITQICGTYLRDSIRSVRMATRTIMFLDDLLKKEGVEYLYIKTYRPIPYAPNDIDVLVHKDDFEYFTRLLSTYGFKIMRRGVEVRFLREDMTRIDVYSSIIYAGVEFDIKDQLFSKRTSVDFLGSRNFSIPSPELDALIVLLHDVLGHRTINYLDYYYIRYYLLKNLTSNMTFRFIYDITKGTDLIKRCIALLLLLEHDGTLKNIKNFPIKITPPLMFSTMMLDFSLQKKILYGSSLLVDVFLRFYNDHKNIIPEELRKAVQTILFYHRLIVGDRHTTW
ncbi:MAG: hypothetical protein QW607_07730 [Desulfurococcaceae archaeon]